VITKKDEAACKVCKHFRRPPRPNSIVGKLEEFWHKRRVLSSSARGKKQAGIQLLVMAVVLSVLLAALGTLQYRWLGQVSDGELGQMKSYLNATANRVARDFDSELTDAYNAFYPDLSPGAVEDGTSYANQYIRWASGAQYPSLIKNIWLATANKDSSFDLKRLIPDEYKFQSCPWPDELNHLRQSLSNLSQGAQNSLAAQNSNRNGPNRLGSLEIRRMDEEVPALLIPISRSAMLREEEPFSTPTSSNLIILGLDLAYIREQMLPEIIEKISSNDSQSDFRIEVVSSKNPDDVIFFSDLQKRIATGAKQSVLTGKADVTVDFFKLRSPWFSFPNQGQSKIDGQITQANMSKEFSGPPPNEPMPNDPGRAGFAPSGPGGGPGGEGQGLWRILIQHKDGSINAAVANARHRNLTIGFGVLLLLFGSAVMIVISTRRFLHLAQQQIEFVAGVTHELRTPISVICLAGENLADKVIHNNEQIAQYGTLIRDEGRRLASTIEQVLQFAGAHSYWKKQEFQQVNVKSLIDRAILDCRSMIEEKSFNIVQEIQPDLPETIGNEAALLRAMRNLLSNAMKFSGASRWIGVRAETCACKLGSVIKIIVQDRGFGIPHNEQSSIFEPFFRGKNATTNQVRGNGLGLSLVKKIVEAHGGHVNVDSKVGRGSTFTVLLPLKEVSGAREGIPGIQQVLNY
jgi:two-component system, OmpR family, sensor histidine kinase SenX3